MSAAQPFSPTFNAFQPVEGVHAKPPRLGLLASAVAPDNPGERWEQGFAWRPEICIEPQTFSQCQDIGSFPTPDPEDLVYCRPPAFRVVHICPTRQVRDVDLDKARRQCDAATDYAVAAELWSGTETQTDPYVTPTGTQTMNYWLASSTATQINSGTAYTSPAEALGALEQAARAASRGQQIFIHMPSTMAQLDPYNFRREGSLLLTEQDSVVVVDAGYPGTGPTGALPAAAVWIYATGPVTVRTSTIDVLDTEVQTINRGMNTREIWAQRYFAATFDPCVHFAAQVSTAGLG
jgi:hypothetical protein